MGDTVTSRRKLENKTAIVTGGARGIGAAFCEALAAEGANIVVADILDGTAATRRIADAGGQATYARTDVSSETDVATLLAAALDRFGTVDILVNNAAVFASLTKKPFTEIEPAEWDLLMAVNVRGPYLCARAVAPTMMNKASGRIINMASGTVFKGNSGMLHYVTSKGAVVAMTRSLARELGPYNICVNAIAPGLTMSEGVLANPGWLGPAADATRNTRAMKREQKPHDIVGTLIFLASEDSAFMTGQTLVVDGGAVMR
jgi:NAD(P)-dependent dehydrogenase (short-subunit alcohol dehydrogenase family)